MRIGHGFDVHRFGPGDSVRLGGVAIPHTQGVIAHSDGDVLLHALMDALLGAAGLGDIGGHFPPGDARYAGADSRALLREVAKLVSSWGIPRRKLRSHAARGSAANRSPPGGDLREHRGRPRYRARLRERESDDVRRTRRARARRGACGTCSRAAAKTRCRLTRRHLKPGIGSRPDRHGSLAKRRFPGPCASRPGTSWWRSASGSSRTAAKRTGCCSSKRKAPIPSSLRGHWRPAQVGRPQTSGFAGLKDRRAIARQWFSVPAAKDNASFIGYSGDGFRVLGEHPHSRKLRRGALAGNHFRIRVRGLQGDAAAIDARIAQVKATGVPNYFGAQRFGIEGANLRRVREWLETGRLPRGREPRAFLLSSARALAFNAVLGARVTANSWNRLLPGEVVNLSGSKSVFAADNPDEGLVRRLREGDVSPTGPLCGTGGILPGGEAARVEEDCARGGRSTAGTHGIRRAAGRASRARAAAGRI